LDPAFAADKSKGSHKLSKLLVHFVPMPPLRESYSNVMLFIIAPLIGAGAAGFLFREGAGYHGDEEHAANGGEIVLRPGRFTLTSRLAMLRRPANLSPLSNFLDAAGDAIKDPPRLHKKPDISGLPAFTSGVGQPVVQDRHLLHQSRCSKRLHHCALAVRVSLLARGVATMGREIGLWQREQRKREREEARLGGTD
jgi:hypothetical protein